MLTSSTVLGADPFDRPMARTINPAYTSCTEATEWFDTAAFTCRACGQNEVADTTTTPAGRSCVCKPGHVRADPGAACTPCAAGQAPNREATTCLPCDGATTTTGQGSEVGQCTCAQADQIFTETVAGGSGRVLTLACSACQAGEFPGAGWECKKCAHFVQEYKPVKKAKPRGAYSCQCKAGYRAAGAGCVTEADYVKFSESLPPSGYLSVTYRFRYLANGQKDPNKPLSLDSDVFAHYFVEAGIGCWQDKVPRHCQVLANLCVLTLYDQDSGPCRFLRKTIAGGSWTDQLSATVPWIQYTGTGTGKSATLRTQTLADQGYNVVPAMKDDKNTGASKYLKFQLGQYALNGTWLGYTELGAQLSICSMSYQDVLNLKRFGMQTETSCEFPIVDLRKGLAELEHVKDANVFYELYLEDTTGKLANIPVLIRNYRSSGGALPNSGNKKDEWIFSRRFFIYDTVSGIKAGYTAGRTPPQVVRWASDIKLKVTMDQSQQASNKKLYRPYLIVEYKERDVSTVAETEQAGAALQVDYFSDYEPTLGRVLTAFCILFVAALGVAGLRIYYFCARNPKAAMRAEEGIVAHLWMCLYYVLHAWSDFMFWLLVGTTFVIYVTYKGQESAGLLLPELGEASATLYRAFNAVFGLTLAFRAIANLMRVV